MQSRGDPAFFFMRCLSLAAAATLVALAAACSPRFDWRELAQPSAG